MCIHVVFTDVSIERRDNCQNKKTADFFLHIFRLEAKYLVLLMSLTSLTCVLLKGLNSFQICHKVNMRTL